jgi:hypothetical protein
VNAVVKNTETKELMTMKCFFWMNLFIPIRSILCSFYFFSQEMHISEFKTTFDGVLQTYVDEKISQSKQLLGSEKLNKVISYIETFIFSGGKRIRPFCLWSVYV